jgi:diadenosine tetraphosphate (Ap4A) HIT family hydrolase
MKECAVCSIIRKRNDKEKDYLIAELDTGYAIISNRWQYFKGYTLFICKECVGELHELPLEYRRKYLFEMSVVSEALIIRSDQ